MKFRRVVLLILDGVGIGAAPDAELYGDVGTNTLAHVAATVGGLHLPTLSSLGLGCLGDFAGVPPASQPVGSWGRLREISTGKDSTTGHWELLGVVQAEPFATYPQGFPAEILAEWEQIAGAPPLGNVAASGTEIIQRLGAEHLRTGRPIVYTSADSVFQVAAHEGLIPPERLYDLCRRMRRRLDRWRIGRVIARPFVGGSESGFVRTSHRHDFSMEPPGETVLDALLGAGIPVHGVGKVGDLFAGRGFSRLWPTAGNRAGMDRTLELIRAGEEGLVFTNLVDFDMLWGHRNDAAGFAAGLLEVDRWLSDLLPLLGQGDLLMMTADHGCDPTTPGTDHTREYVPLLVCGPSCRAGINLGELTGFGGVGASVAAAFGVPWKDPDPILRVLLQENAESGV